jgi:hypothetical protein
MFPVLEEFCDRPTQAEGPRRIASAAAWKALGSRNGAGPPRLSQIERRHNRNPETDSADHTQKPVNRPVPPIPMRHCCVLEFLKLARVICNHRDASSGFSMHSGPSLAVHMNKADLEAILLHGSLAGSMATLVMRAGYPSPSCART